MEGAALLEEFKLWGHLLPAQQCKFLRPTAAPINKNASPYFVLITRRSQLSPFYRPGEPRRQAVRERACGHVQPAAPSAVLFLHGCCLPPLFSLRPPCPVSQHCLPLLPLLLKAERARSKLLLCTGVQPLSPTCLT